MQPTERTELANALSEATDAWACWSTTDTNVGVDFLLGRGAFAQAFGVFAAVPYDLESSPGCVIAYPRIAKAQSLAAATGSKAIVIVKSSDGTWWADAMKPETGTIELPRKREEWPAESHGSALLAYRLLRSALKPLRPHASR